MEDETINNAYDVQSIDEQINALKEENLDLSKDLGIYEASPIAKWFRAPYAGEAKEQYSQNASELDMLIKQKTALLDSERQRINMLKQFDTQREALKKVGVSDKYLLQYSSMFNRDFVKTGEPNYNALEFSSNKGQSKSAMAAILGVILRREILDRGSIFPVCHCGVCATEDSH